MTLAETLLPKLASLRPADGRHAVSLSDDAWAFSVELTAERTDAVGCKLWEVQVIRRGPATAEAAPLAERARRAAAEVTGLLEPLRLVEADAGRDEALLRSDKPARRGGKRHYYEVSLRGRDRAAVRRYQAAEAGAKRQPVEFALTHEAIAKLADDLARALD